MDGIFSETMDKDMTLPQMNLELKNQPLAARLRPRSIDDVVGQDHILGKGKLLRRTIEADRLSSIILYGPPGCGKTSLAEVIALSTKRHFTRLSAVVANVAALRSALEEAQKRSDAFNRQTVLFIDEIHRFNKSQQDVLLPYVEDGAITLIGATTHNPFFFINAPLLSRSLLFELQALTPEAVKKLLEQAVKATAASTGQAITVAEEALEHLAKLADGDARRALNALEMALLTTHPDSEGQISVSLEVAEESIQKKAVIYDHDEDGHYDTISAFIKSVRGSDPDAALYWLAKMLHAGEDPRFIVRRLIILASEDIGNADPRGLSVAVAAMHAVEMIGMPEARLTLAQATTYLATAPKSNASYMALEAAAKDLEQQRTLAVPKPLRGTGYRGAKALGHTGYQYAHDHPGHFVVQEYLPEDKVYYKPTNQGYEANIAQRLAFWRGEKKKAQPVGTKPEST